MHISNDFPSFVSLGQRDRTLGPISKKRNPKNYTLFGECRLTITIRPAGGQPPAGLLAARGLAALRAYLVIGFFSPTDRGIHPKAVLCSHRSAETWCFAWGVWRGASKRVDDGHSAGRQALKRDFS
jgi:hypothetical protein